jgi:hypothetical protein
MQVVHWSLVLICKSTVCDACKYCTASAVISCRLYEKHYHHSDVVVCWYCYELCAAAMMSGCGLIIWCVGVSDIEKWCNGALGCGSAFHIIDVRKIHVYFLLFRWWFTTLSTTKAEGSVPSALGGDFPMVLSDVIASIWRWAVWDVKDAVA